MLIAQDFGNRADDQLFYGRLRRDELRSVGLCDAGRERSTVNLARGRERKTLGHVHTRRHRCGWQDALEVSSQPGWSDLRRRHHHLRVDFGLANVIFPRHRDGFDDAGKLSQARLDFAELDADASNLDLVVGATKKFELTRAAQNAAVAAAVHSPAYQVGIGSEASAGEPVVTQILAGHVQTANADLAGNTDWGELIVRVEHVRRDVAQRAPDRQCPPVVV